MSALRSHAAARTHAISGAAAGVQALAGAAPTVRPERPAPRFFLVLMVGATILLATVIYPVLTDLFLATVLAAALWPLQRRLTRPFRGSRGAAAGVLTAAVTVGLLAPLAMLTIYVVRDGSAAVRYVTDTAQSERVTELVSRLPAATRGFVTDAIARMPRDLGEAVWQAGTKGGRFAAEGARLAMHAGFMLIALFFLLVQGDKLVAWIDSISPLGHGETKELLAGFKQVSLAVIVSALVTAGVQAVAALAGYVIAGVPSPLFFAVITFFFAFVPAIGAAFVCLVAALLLFVTGHPYMAIFLAAWGVVIVGLVDNVIKPLLIKRGMHLHGGVVFFSLIGGLAAFGAVGLLVGPLVVAFFLALVRMYHRDYSPDDSHVPPMSGLPR